MEKSTLKEMKFGKEKLKNIWFFYKWQIIVGLVLLVTGLFLLIQCARKKDADVYIYFAGPAHFTEKAQNELCEAFDAVIPDEYGTSFKIISTVIGQNSTIGSTEEEKQQHAVDYAGKQEDVNEFKSQMRLPNTVICILSPNCCKIAGEDGSLRPLSDVLDVLPEGAGTYGIRLSDLPFYESNSILRQFPEGSLLCLKNATVFHDKKDYERQVAAFVSIVTWNTR